ncbi:MAG: YwaF family protein [Clostridia bacterium]|nr:YwaF family protein [Clostridia bacterium]
MDHFWIHRDQIYEQELSIGFKTFSAGHIIWLLGIIAFCFLTGLLYRRLGENGRDRMRKILGLVIVALEYLKVIVMGLCGIKMLEFVPLHLCSAAGFAVVIYAFWPRMKALGQIFAYVFMPAAMLAVAFPSSTMYPWWNFYCLHTFIFHALLIAFFVWLFMSGEVVPDYKGVWIGLLFVTALAVPTYFIDGAFGVNYMFIGTRSDVGILAAMWDAIVPSYGRIVFTLVMGLIMIAVAHILFLVYFLIGKIRGRKGSTKKTRAD